MNWIALRMLMGDRAKYFGLIFGVSFATLLMTQQVSIFMGILTRTASQIVQQHFNVGESQQPAGPLFGAQFSQLACSGSEMCMYCRAKVPQ